MRTPIRSDEAPLELDVRPLALQPLAERVVDQSWSKLVDVVDGAAPSMATSFFVSRTAESLIVDVVATAEVLQTRHFRRNAALHEDDVIEVFLQPPIPSPPEGNRYLEVEVSPAGVLFDAWVTNRTNLEDPNADRDLELAFNRPDTTRPRVEVLLDGVVPSTIAQRRFRVGLPAREWRLRLTVPFEGFAWSSRPHVDIEKSQWRANVFRIQRLDQHTKEHTAWCPTGKVDFHRPECFGVFDFFDQG